MKFNKFSKITNLSSKGVQYVYDLGLADESWIICEKVHGANFSITVDKVGNKSFAKRNGFLKKDETFYSHHKVAWDMEFGISRLATLVGYEDQITVFGEICGGSFYGKTDMGSKKVQSGVHYHPSTKFLAFDIMIDGEYLPPIVALRLLNQANFDIVPILGVFDSLNEAIEVSHTFESLVPQKFNLIPQLGNIAEGYILQPFEKSANFGNGKRLIFKHKADKFSEKGDKVVKAPKELSEELAGIIEQVSVYITRQRWDNIISKEGQLTAKDFGRLIGVFSKDVTDDFTEDTGYVLKDLLDKDEKRLVMKVLNSRIKDVMMRNWLELIEE